MILIRGKYKLLGEAEDLAVILIFVPNSCHENAKNRRVSGLLLLTQAELLRRLSRCISAQFVVKRSMPYTHRIHILILVEPSRLIVRIYLSSPVVSLDG